MKEIRIHGRGGQGVKTVAQVIGRAAYLAGFSVQDFALYGAERRGAPLVSFVRFDTEPILERGYIYTPDLVIIIDPTVPQKSCLAGCRDKTPVVSNAYRHIEGAVTFNATEIALAVLGRPTPNTTMAGAAVHFIAEISLEQLLEGIALEMAGKFPPHVVEKNLQAARQGYDAVAQHLEAS